MGQTARKGHSLPRRFPSPRRFEALAPGIGWEPRRALLLTMAVRRNSIVAGSVVVNVGEVDANSREGHETSIRPPVQSNEPGFSWPTPTLRKNGPCGNPATICTIRISVGASCVKVGDVEADGPKGADPSVRGCNTNPLSRCRPERIKDQPGAHAVATPMAKWRPSARSGSLLAWSPSISGDWCRWPGGCVPSLRLPIGGWPAFR